MSAPLYLRLMVPLSLAAPILALPSLSLARSPAVYINGVRVDGLTGQSLTNVDVQFDEHGDVRITARGYQVKSSEEDATTPSAAASPSAPAVSAGSGARRFYVASVWPAGRAGMAGWDIDLYVNQAFVRKFRSRDPEPLLEITRWLRVGANSLRFVARREEGQRASNSPADFFELVVGDGESRAGRVLLNKLGAFRRSAAESGTLSGELNLTVAALAPPEGGAGSPGASGGSSPETHH